jgi:hypothetical protein
VSDFARYAPKLILLPLLFAVGEFVGRWVAGDDAAHTAFSPSSLLGWAVFLLPVALALFVISNVFPGLLSERLPRSFAKFRGSVFGEVDR